MYCVCNKLLELIAIKTDTFPVWQLIKLTILNLVFKTVKYIFEFELNKYYTVTCLKMWVKLFIVIRWTLMDSGKEGNLKQI